MSTSLSKIDPERSQAIPARGIKPLAVYIVPKTGKVNGKRDGPEIFYGWRILQEDSDGNCGNGMVRGSTEGF